WLLRASLASSLSKVPISALPVSARPMRSMATPAFSGGCPAGAARTVVVAQTPNKGPPRFTADTSTSITSAAVCQPCSKLLPACPSVWRHSSRIFAVVAASNRGHPAASRGAPACMAAAAAFRRDRDLEIALDARRGRGLAERVSTVDVECVAHVVGEFLADDGHDQVEPPAVGRHPGIQVTDVGGRIGDHRGGVEMVRG